MKNKGINKFMDCLIENLKANGFTDYYKEE
jgi:hypothetical protein